MFALASALSTREYESDILNVTAFGVCFFVNNV